MGRNDPIIAALFGHCADVSHMRRYMRHLNPDFNVASDKLILKIVEWSPSYVDHRFEAPIIVRSNGQDVYAFHTAISWLPELVNLSLGQVLGKIEEAIQISVQEGGASYIALGAFTSIICLGQEARLENEYGVTLTSGNTLTAALAIAQLEDATWRFGTPLETATVAIVGGSGDIGSGCALALKNRVKKLILTARGLNRLRKTARQLAPMASAEIEISTDNAYALAQADVVISAAAATEAIIFARDIRPGTIICDLSYPKGLSAEIFKRGDVLAFAGGLSEPPVTMDFGYDMGLPSPRTLYGCFSEAIVLAAEGVTMPFSHGRGNITRVKMDYILSAARKHGFQPAPLYASSHLITDAEIAAIADAARRN